MTPTLPGMPKRARMKRTLPVVAYGPALAAPIEVTIPGIKLESPNVHYFGSRGAMYAQAAKVKKTRGDVTMVLRATFGNPPPPPLLVIITRIAPGQLDDDNLARSGKACRDGVADWVGVDDRTSRGGIAWQYREAKAGKGVYAVHIRIEGRAA